MSVPTQSRPAARWALLAIVPGLCGPIASCAVGPDFHPPEAPAVTRYPTTPVSAETVSADVPAGEAQRFEAARDIPAEWWTLFQCPALDALVRQALRDSPRFAQAQAKLVRAQQELSARQGATKYPKVDAGAGVNGVGLESDAIKAQTPLAEDFPITLATASVSVSYTLDLFGRNRRELEALRAVVEYERFELEGARLMLAGNVVTAAIEEASLRQQIEATEEAVALEGRQLEIVERLEQLGGVPKVDVLSQSGELARTRAAIPALRRRLEQTRHRLAVYLGQPPVAAELPDLHLADLRLPTELPLSLPSDLARQRPDIRAAEALLHEASARVGVATANLYPRITLSGTGGAVAVTPLLNGVAGFALLGASLTQPLFHGGELKARKRSALAALDQAGAAYREAVLSGLQDVADTLVALDADARTLRERVEAARSAKTAYDIIARQYEAGGVSLLTLLDAQRQHVAASIEQTRAIGDRFADSAALFQALGGGWWTAEPAPSAAAER
jgi:NodT family efflux transporter outer membrane factor (OMF) lipoprotein